MSNYNISCICYFVRLHVTLTNANSFQWCYGCFWYNSSWPRQEEILSKSKGDSFISHIYIRYTVKESWLIVVTGNLYLLNIGINLILIRILFGSSSIIYSLSLLMVYDKLTFLKLGNTFSTQAMYMCIIYEIEVPTLDLRPRV